MIGGAWNDTCDINNLFGLNTLNLIGSNLSIVNNDYLSQLSGVDSLQKIGGDFYIHYNDALINLIGPGQLDTVGGSLSAC